MMHVKGFDDFVSHGVILNKLLQETCDEVENRLSRPFFVVAVNVRHRNILVFERCLKMVYND
jgi:hypothetical protein